MLSWSAGLLAYLAVSRAVQEWPGERTLSNEGFCPSQCQFPQTAVPALSLVQGREVASGRPRVSPCPVRPFAQSRSSQVGAQNDQENWIKTCEAPSLMKSSRPKGHCSLSDGPWTDSARGLRSMRSHYPPMKYVQGSVTSHGRSRRPTRVAGEHRGSGPGLRSAHGAEQMHVRCNQKAMSGDGGSRPPPGIQVQGRGVASNQEFLPHLHCVFTSSFSWACQSPVPIGAKALGLGASATPPVITPVLYIRNIVVPFRRPTTLFQPSGSRAWITVGPRLLTGSETVLACGGLAQTVSLCLGRGTGLLYG